MLRLLLKLLQLLLFRVLLFTVLLLQVLLMLLRALAIHTNQEEELQYRETLPVLTVYDFTVTSL